MESNIFRVEQRRILLIWCSAGIACLSVAALAVTFHGYGLAILPGSLGLNIVPACLDVAAGRTELTPDGLETRSLFRNHSCRWDEIEAIGTKVTTGRGNSNTSIVVHLKTRKPIKLCAPFDSSVGGDPHFTASLNQIKACWKKRTVS